MCKLVSLLCLGSLFAANIPTAYYNNARTGANLSETVLTPANVASSDFGKLGTYACAGNIFALPIYAPSVTISGHAYNLIIISTMSNNVCAFDADSPNSAALWTVNLGTPLTNPGGQMGILVYGSVIGCVATPVADAAVVYVVCSTSSTTWVLYRLNITTGATLSSVTISGQVVGTGDPGTSPDGTQSGVPDTTSGPNLVFFPRFSLARTALTLANGTVYIATGSYGDVHPWHGWIFAYDATSLAQVGVFCTTPNGYGGGIWGSSGGLSVDDSGNVYTSTGNGDWNGTTNFGQSIVKLSSTLSLISYYTPADWAAMNTLDVDMNSARSMLAPGVSLLVTGAKDYKVYSMDPTALGGIGGTAQVFYTDAMGVLSNHSGIYGGAFFNGMAYFPNSDDAKIYAFALTGTTFNTTPTLSSATYSFPGAILSGSCNGSSNCILWGVTVAQNANETARAGTLRAFNATTLTQIYSSGTVVADALGTMSKFSAPVVAAGRVYVSTLSGQVATYGLFPGSQIRGQASIRGGATIR